jgi:hypothetical protein
MKEKIIIVLILFVLLSCKREKNIIGIEIKENETDNNVSEIIKDEKLLESYNLRDIPKIDIFDDIIKQMIIDCKNENGNRSYELIEIREINIGIHGVDCFIVIWNFVDDVINISNNWKTHDYNFYGIKYNEIIINEFLGWSYIKVPYETLDGYNYPKKIFDFLETITDFYRIGNDLVLIGDTNLDGNDDIILFSYGDMYNIVIDIFGVNKEFDNISKYLTATFSLSDNGIPVIFNNDGSIKLNKYSNCIWDHDKHKYIWNW